MVDSSYPGCVVAAKGLAVRQIKRYVSWVKYVDGRQEVYINNKENNLHIKSLYESFYINIFGNIYILSYKIRLDYHG